MDGDGDAKDDGPVEKTVVASRFGIGETEGDPVERERVPGVSASVLPSVNV